MKQEAKVLIVDDEPKICQFLEVLLRREGYRPESVYNVTDALAEVGKTTYDLVITDLKMPGMDGFELVQRLKASHKDLPIIMITGYATVETAVKAIRYGVDDYVTKPFNIEEFRKVIARTLLSVHMAQENRLLSDQLRKATVELDRYKALVAEGAAGKAPSRTVAPRAVERDAGASAMRISHVTLPAGEHERDRFLKRKLRAINKKLDAQCGSIMLVEDDALVVRASEGERMKDLIGTRQPMREGIAGTVAREQQAFLVRDVHSDGRLPRRPQRGYRTPSFLCVPISYSGRTLGVINVGDKRSDMPFDEEDLKYVAGKAKRMAPVLNYAATGRTLEEKCIAAIEQLTHSLESENPYTHNHSHRVANLACALGKACGIPVEEIELLRRAAGIINLGKAAAGAGIMKKTKPLTDRDREALRTYPVMSERLVHSLKFMDPALPMIRHCRERMDGNGYPDGLRGQEIPHLARVLSIADAYVAMTSDRPHRRAMSPESAAAELRSAAGAQFDVALTKTFCEQVLPRECEG